MNGKYYIEQVEITDLWNQHSLHTKLHKDINLFIGINGSGKTTLINVIKSVLNIDLEALNDLEFKAVKLVLRNKFKRTKTISILKEEKLGYKYKVGNKSYNFSFETESNVWFRYSYGVKQNSLFFNNKKIEELKKEFQDLFSLNIISVYRQSDKNKDSFYISNKDEDPHKNPIDEKIESLETKFNNYRLLINTEINKESDEFRKNVFRKTLNLETSEDIISSLVMNIKDDDLKLALKNLGLTQKKDTVLIEDFIKKQKEFLNKFKKTLKKEPGKGASARLELDDVLYIPNAHNLKNIIHLSNIMEDKKKELNKPIDDFLEITNKFLFSSKFNKKIYIEDDKLKIKNRDNQEIPLAKLSSGEKQLLILLLETLLQKNASIIYIIDEPEISLHIDWQRELVGGILKLNSNIQLIIATHSPEIVARYKGNIIRMEKIIQ